MRAPFLLFIAILLSVQPLMAGQLLCSFGSQLALLDPATGRRTDITPTGLDQRINANFTIDAENKIGYEFGFLNGKTSLSTIDLSTGTLRVIPFKQFLSFAPYDGDLLASSGEDVLRLDPLTGETTFLAPTGIDRLVNFQFIVDAENDLAYAFGLLGNALSLSTIDLQTGTSHVIPFPHVFGFRVYKGQLLGTRGPEIFQIDPINGETTLIATTGLDNAINLQFAVDGAEDTAYVFGNHDNVPTLSTIDLLTGFSFTVPLRTEEFPSLEVFDLRDHEPVKITGVEKIGSGFRLEAPRLLGRQVGVEYSPDFSQDSWIELGNFSPDGEQMFFNDADAIRGSREHGFYRAFLRPLIL